jgi:hypothetical protein
MSGEPEFAPGQDFHLPEEEHARLNGAVSAVSARTSARDKLSALSTLSAQRDWRPPVLEPAALHGLAGRWVEAAQPHTEPSAAGILLVTLTAFGSAAGRTPHIDVGFTPHHANESVLLVGPTATGRKGETTRAGMRPIELADVDWQARVHSGFGSGEAVVAEVRDETENEPGAEDKRLLVQEDEFASVLAVAGRDGSTLSMILRNAWDGRPLQNRTKARKTIATGAHVSAVCAITPEELRRRVPEAEIANGFLNRFLLVAVYRSKLLPEPHPIPGNVVGEYAQAFASALAFARRVGCIERDADARGRWDVAYREELSIDRHGLAGAVCSRAEAHVARLSMLYALLDNSDRIRLPHLEAALAVWRYCERSALLVFGDRLGEPTADAIVEALTAGDLTRDQIRDQFSRHKTAAELDLALDLLQTMGRVEALKVPTGGRPATHYRLLTVA